MPGPFQPALPQASTSLLKRPPCWLPAPAGKFTKPSYTNIVTRPCTSLAGPAGLAPWETTRLKAWEFRLHNTPKTSPRCTLSQQSLLVLLTQFVWLLGASLQVCCRFCKLILQPSDLLNAAYAYTTECFLPPAVAAFALAWSWSLPALALTIMGLQYAWRDRT